MFINSRSPIHRIVFLPLTSLENHPQEEGERKNVFCFYLPVTLKSFMRSVRWFEYLFVVLLSKLVLYIFYCLYTDRGEVYTWGWKECVPSGKIFGDLSIGTGLEKDVLERQSSSLTDQGTAQT